MDEKVFNFGEKSEEYPYGYGWCQCGCGKKVLKLSNGTSLKFWKNHIKVERRWAKEKVGMAMEGYEKGWGLCQCGCGKKTTMGWQKINGKLVMTAHRYYKFHYAKTEKSRKRQSRVGLRVLRQRDYSSFVNYGLSQHGLHFSRKLGFEVGYMSTYEKAAFKLLDCDPEVESYIPQPFSIDYKYEGIQRNYNPDILVYYRNGQKTIIEVKPKTLMKLSKNLAKIQALKSFCKKRDFNFEIWDEEVLMEKSKLLNIAND